MNLIILMNYINLEQYDKLKLTNNNNDFLIIKDNYVNITSLSTFINYQLNLKLILDYNGNYPTNSETINIYDNISAQTTYNFNIIISNSNY